MNFSRNKGNLSLNKSANGIRAGGLIITRDRILNDYEDNEIIRKKRMNDLLKSQKHQIIDKLKNDRFSKSFERKSHALEREKVNIS